MHNRIEFDKKKTEFRRLRLGRHMPTREHTPKDVYNRKRENREWKKEN